MCGAQAGPGAGGPQQGGKGVEGQAEEGERAQQEPRRVHHPDGGGRVRLVLHLSERVRETLRMQKKINKEKSVCARVPTSSWSSKGLPGSESTQ